MKKFAYPVAFFGWLLVASLVSGRTRAQTPDAKNRQQNSRLCTECIKIRVGLPQVIRGPAPDIEDFTEIQLRGGRFRGFVAAAKTYAIDGDHPWDMSGPARVVLDRGPRGTYDDSGQWIHHVEQSGKTILAFIHNESGDRPGQGLQSMSLAVSTDYGLTWKSYGQIITGKGAVLRLHKVTGTADCTAIKEPDGDYYAYCWQNGTGHGDGATIIALAPVSDPVPSQWKKYDLGKWDQPGIGGDATGLAKGVGGSAARWTTTGEILLLGHLQKGIGLRFSTDGMNFTAMQEPLLLDGGGSWHPRNPLEIISCPVVVRPKNRQQSALLWLLDAVLHVRFSLTKEWVGATLSIAPGRYRFQTRLSALRSESWLRDGITQPYMTAGLRRRLFPPPMAAITKWKPGPGT